MNGTPPRIVVNEGPPPRPVESLAFYELFDAGGKLVARDVKLLDVLFGMRDWPTRTEFILVRWVAGRGETAAVDARWRVWRDLAGRIRRRRLPRTRRPWEGGQLP